MKCIIVFLSLFKKNLLKSSYTTWYLVDHVDRSYPLLLLHGSLYHHDPRNKSSGWCWYRVDKSLSPLPSKCKNFPVALTWILLQEGTNLSHGDFILGCIAVVVVVVVLFSRTKGSGSVVEGMSVGTVSHAKGSGNTVSTRTKTPTKKTNVSIKHP